MQKELRWRIVYGYGANDYISIREDQLEKAKYAMITGKVFAGDKMISGSEIKRIEEDYRFYTGWYDTYNPKDSEDYAQIKRDVPTQLLLDRAKIADNRVGYLVRNNKPLALLENPKSLDQLMLN